MPRLFYHPSSAEAEEIDILGTSEGTKNEILLADAEDDPNFFVPVVSPKSICWSKSEVTSAKLRLTKSSPKILNSSLSSILESASASSTLVSKGWLILWRVLTSSSLISWSVSMVVNIRKCRSNRKSYVLRTPWLEVALFRPWNRKVSL